MIKKLIVAICVSVTAITAVYGWPGSKIGSTRFSLNRDFEDLSKLPQLKADNKSDKPVEFTVKTTLVDRYGKVTTSINSSIKVSAKGSASIDPLKGGISKIENGAMLLKSEITGIGGSTIISGIFGHSKPVKASAVDIFGINVHLGRYKPHVQWTLLQMMRAAGITQIREDSMFLDCNDSKNVTNQLNHLRQVVLGVEAFGMRPLILLGYFPSPFYQSSHKLKMAYDWAKMIGREFKGRVDYNYGNETNSGWAGYGAAADMANLNKAFALGTTEVDQAAGRGSFGIAEGLNNYIVEFIKNDTLKYLNALCVHPYCGTPENGIAKSFAAKKRVRCAGGNQQIWCTEIGFHVDKHGKLNPLTKELTGVAGFSEKHQTQFLTRLYTLALSHGIKRVYWYDFFGLRDAETFWLVDKNFKPRSAYKAYTECTRHLKHAIPCGTSDFADPIQRHYFKRKDGSVFMVAWGLKNGIKADFKLSAKATVVDCLGKAVKVPGDGYLMLGHGPVYIENPPSKTLFDKAVIVSSMDKRHFHKPMSRFTAKPGQKLTIPFVSLNGSGTPIVIRSYTRWNNPGWKVKLPEPVEIAAGKDATQSIVLSVPPNAVPGVEYVFRFAGIVDESMRTYPYSVRIKIDGKFPYQRIIDYKRNANYPKWNSFNETGTGKGNPELTAKRGTATIDGNLNEWKAEEFFPIDQKFQWILRDPGAPSDTDWSGYVAFRWDENKLYAAFLVRDDDLGFTDLISRDWRDCDNVRLMLSSTADPKKRPKKITANDILLIMAPTGITRAEGPLVNVASLGGLTRNGVEKQLEMSSNIWKDGYVLEVAVPFKLFNAKPAVGTILGLNVMADDCDDNYRQHVGMTYLKDFNYWNCPRSTGNLKLIK